MRSIIQDTLAIPAFTSLRISEPRSELLRENSLSFHPLVLLEIDSLYLNISVQKKLEKLKKGKLQTYTTAKINKGSFHKLYLIDTALSLDFKDSEKD